MADQRRQIRHREFGLYQGTCLGLGFWYPLSEMPEQGVADFPDQAGAQRYVDFLCSKDCADPLKPEDLSIEPFDAELDKALRDAFPPDRPARAC